MKSYERSLEAHKITNVFYLIIIIPCLLIALIAASIMFNAKSAGGYANIFGIYVVELKNNNFYNSQTDEYKMGTKQMFKATPAKQIKTGDIVAVYSGTASEELEIKQTLSVVANNSTTFGIGTNETTSKVKVVKIGTAVTLIDKNNNKYLAFTYYDSPTSEEMKGVDAILASDIMGVAVPTNATIANVIDYCKTLDSLIFLVLLPCVILLTIKFMSLGFYHRYEVGIMNQRKVRNSYNGISYSQVVNSNERKNIQTPQYGETARPQTPRRMPTSQFVPNPKTPTPPRKIPTVSSAKTRIPSASSTQKRVVSSKTTITKKVTTKK